MHSSDGLQARQMEEEKMDVAKKEDIILLADEKFDFDLSLSSLSANEDDEVFFGPVGHKERCIAASLELNNRIPDQPVESASSSSCTWSPLTGDKFVEVYKEAHLLALRIEVAQAAKLGNPSNQGVERFIQGSELKISLFEKEQKMEKSPMSLKRETFCLSDSSSMVPQPPGAQCPTGEPQLPASSPALPSAPAPTGPVPTKDNLGLPQSSQPLPREPSTSHPPNKPGPQKRITRKLQLPRALPVRGRRRSLATEKSKKEVPDSLQRMKFLNEKESHRDALLDKPSTAVDAAGLPARGSHPGQGKGTLPVPNKLGPRKTLLKPPSCFMKKSSSLASASSLTPSVCASPVAGKAKSGELTSVPTSGSRLLTGTSKLGRIGPTTLPQALPAAPARASCRQASRDDDAQPMTEKPKGPSTATLTQPQALEPGGTSLDPDSMSPSSQLNKAGSMRRRGSTTTTVPVPAHPFKTPQLSAGESPNGVTPKFPRTQRLQSWASAGRVVHSTPVRRSSGPTPQGLPSSMKTPTSARRMSTLPTPVSRRLSGLPLMTPQSMPKPLVSPLCVPARRLSSEPRKRSVRADLAQETSRNASGQAGRGLSSDESSSPPSSVPQALHFSPEKSDFPLSQGSTIGAAQNVAEPREHSCSSEALVDIRLDQLTITPETGGRDLADRPLIDFSNTPEANMALGPSSRPLLDLVMNTPDTDRNCVGKPLKTEVGQLIDLGSPLIQLSPEAEKENVDSPLLRF